MYLTQEEQNILDGKYGSFKQMCMCWLVEWGEAMKAKRMVPVTNVHALFSDQGNCIKGADSKIINSFFQELMNALNEGAQCFTTTDVSYMSDEFWEEFNTNWQQVENNRQLLNAATCSGFNMVWTCIPYFIGSIPLKGEICAWAESSCIPFCNSVLGARTTRHSQASSMAAAVLGITPEFGELLDENRLGDVLVEVNVELDSRTDWGALGYRTDGMPMRTIINYHLLSVHS